MKFHIFQQDTIRIMPKQKEIDEICMKSAEEWLRLSKCDRKKVACIIYKPENNTIISVGYNGTPHGFDMNVRVMITHTGGYYTLKQMLL